MSPHRTDGSIVRSNSRRNGCLIDRSSGRRRMHRISVVRNTYRSSYASQYRRNQNSRWRSSHRIGASGGESSSYSDSYSYDTDRRRGEGNGGYTNGYHRRCSRSIDRICDRKGYGRRGNQHRNEYHKKSSGGRYTSTNKRYSYRKSAYSPRSTRHRKAYHDASDSTRYYRSKRQKSRSYGRTHGHRDSHETEKKRKAKKEDRSDSIIHFDWWKGQMLNKRYRVLGLMGEGTFGRVLKCYDVKWQSEVAIKVVRDVQRYTEAAKIEANILRDIQAIDVEHQNRCVTLWNSFMHEGRHMCLVFEKLGLSLYDFLYENDKRGFFLSDIQEFTRQCLQALSFLECIKLTHTDLKPENVLLECGRDEVDMVPFMRDRSGSLIRRPRRADVKLIDFGNATYEHMYHSSIVNTRQYRAPEVILGLGWSMSSDMWSLGCILMELYTGTHLFKAHEHLEHLVMIERIVGPFPPRMLAAAEKAEGSKYLHPTENRLNWPEGATGSSSINRVKNSLPLLDLVLPVHRPFAEFVRYLLEIEASNRPTPQAALQHPFLHKEIAEY